MSQSRSLFTTTLFITVFSLLHGCSDSGENTAPSAPEAEVAEVAASAEDVSPESQDASADVAEDAQAIDPESLQPAGTIELTQYTVAYGGSGTMGGGTFTIDGKSHPFTIAGLGIGGIGASAVDATGVVYNLPGLEAFPGTYGNARLGMTAGESGGGKLWLRNPDGVVIKLETEMRGLALAGGVDGIIIQWDEESTMDRAMDDTTEVVGEGIEAGADAVEKGVGKVKGWFKGDD